MRVIHGTWVFACPKCAKHVRVHILMPRCGPTADCVACNVPMVQVAHNAEPLEYDEPQSAAPTTWTASQHVSLDGGEETRP